MGTLAAQLLTVWLSGEEQSPPVDTTAYAMCVISFNTDSNNITYNLTFNEVPTPIDSFRTLPLTSYACLINLTPPADRAGPLPDCRSYSRKCWPRRQRFSGTKYA